MLGPVKSFSKPTTIVDEVARVLADRIVRGELSPGTRLKEEQLAEEFGVSRPPIRESLRVLQRDGLVVIVPRHGAHVTAVSAMEIAEIYSCRVALEGMSSRLAAERMDDATIDAFDGLILEMGEAVEKGNTNKYFRLNVRFHEQVGIASGNSRLRELLRMLGAQVLRMRYASLGLPDRMKYSYQMHERIVAAFRERDGGAAEELTRELIEEAATALVAHLRDAESSAHPREISRAYARSVREFSAAHSGRDV